MKVATALAAAMLFIVPAAAFAQDTGEGAVVATSLPVRRRKTVTPLPTAPRRPAIPPPPPQSQGQMGGDKGQ